MIEYLAVGIIPVPYKLLTVSASAYDINSHYLF